MQVVHIVLPRKQASAKRYKDGHLISDNGSNFVRVPGKFHSEESFNTGCSACAFWKTEHVHLCPDAPCDIDHRFVKVG